MRTLVAFSLLVAAVLAEPQYIYSGVAGVPYTSGGYYPAAGVLPVTSSYVHSPAVVSPYYAAAPAITSYVAPSVVAYPSQDTSRGLPQPVQDTPEVKAAKEVFSQQYAQAAVKSAVKPYVHTVQKRAAVLPVVPYKSYTPQVYTSSPLVSSSYYGASYVPSYNYGVAAPAYATYY